MGKDKRLYKQIEKAIDESVNEITERCNQDCAAVIENGGFQYSLYKQCWMQGFLYAGERINHIFELSKKE